MDAIAITIAVLLGLAIFGLPALCRAETVDCKTVRLFIPIAGVEFAETEEDGEKVVTSRIQVCRAGHWFHPWYGEFDITPSDHRKMKKNHKNSKRRVVVDYQHNSTHPDPDWAVAAGWVVEGSSLVLEDDANKLLADIEWTQKAIERIQAKEYQFISPEIDFNYANPETGEEEGPALLAIGLTNRPFLEGMDPVMVATEPVVMGAVRFTAGSNSRHHSGGSAMDEAKVRELLGLAGEVKLTLKHWQQAATKLSEQLAAKETIVEEALAADDPAAPVAVLNQPANGHVTLTAEQYNALKAGADAGSAAQVRLREMHLERLIDTALSVEFKVVPAEIPGLKKLGQKDFDAVKELIDARPKNLFKQLVTETGSGAAGEDAGGETPADRAVAIFRKHRAFYEGLGHTEEDAKKYPKAFL